MLRVLRIIVCGASYRVGQASAQCHLVSRRATSRNKTMGLCFIDDLPRFVSTISAISKSRTGLLFRRAVSEAWIWFPARDLQRQCGGVAHDEIGRAHV